RRRARIHRLDGAPDRVGGQDALLDEELAQRALHALIISERPVVIGARRMRVRALMMMVVIVMVVPLMGMRVAAHRSPRSRRLEPVLIDFDLDGVLRRAPILRPDLALAEAHAIKRLGRETGAVIGELLGIAEGAAETLDLADMA